MGQRQGIHGITMTSKFPWIPNAENIRITSAEDEGYNCFAWAVGDTSHWIDPTDPNTWPGDISNENTVPALFELFAKAGYQPCQDGSLEDGYEKIVIYALDGEPTHAARQLRNGLWTSKLGKHEDIDHATPEELQGDEWDQYGRISGFMSRPRV